MPELKLKFQKFDKFDNPVFICLKSDIPESYTMLEKYHKLLSKKVKTFLPIFAHKEHQYATIRFFKHRKYKKFVDGATYVINFNIAMKKKNEKNYINCFIQSVQFISKPEKIDEGEIMDLDAELADLTDF